jgi:polyisoprenoid-binding protein YceI
MRFKWVLIPLLAMALAAGCAGGKQQNGGSTPVAAQPPAGTSSAASQVQAGTPADGTYTVAKDQSSAWYSVHEVFLDKKVNATAVGKTSAIEGQLVFQKGAIQPSKVTVDVRSLKSDQDRRDNIIKTRALESSKYPTAEFSVTGVDGNTEALAEGKTVPLKLKGNLLVHGVAKPVVWDGTATMQNGAIHLTANVAFVFKDFGMEPPNILNLISVDEHIRLDVDLTATKR